MKDKEKQIEEMAKCMANCENTCDECFEQLESVMTMKIKDREQHCQAYMFAKRAVEQGYQKVDKDKQVLLSREEYDNLKLEIQKAHNKGVSVGFDLTKYKENSIEIARKETAREILKEIENLCGFNNRHYCCGEIITIRDVNELAKQYGVEIKE